MSDIKTLSYYESLFHIFNSIYPVSDELRKAIIESSSVLEVKKKTLLLNAGAHSNFIYFVVKGATRIFYTDNDGNETTTWFLLENELVISVYGFFTGKQSLDSIEAMEDCTLIALHRDQLDKLYSNFMELNFIGRKLTEFYYLRTEEQTNNLRILNAKQRYDHFLLHNPKLLRRASLGHIASYLGISQETLSRIRRK